MDQPTEDLLAARRLRSAELALDAARARLSDQNRELDGLRAHVHRLQTQLLAREADLDHERERLLNPHVERLQAQLAEARRRRVAAEQALEAERARGDELAARLSAEAGPREADGVERELAVALRRAGALAGELELVRRHASDFEQSVRVAVAGAWGRLDDLGHRVDGALAELEGRAAGGHRAPGDDAAAEGDAIAAERLDEALDRLRAQLPPRAPGPEPGPESGPGEPPGPDSGPRAAPARAAPGWPRRRFRGS